MRVLVIDDEPDIRRIARVSLGRVGHMEVLEAESADEGVRLAHADAPDVVLLDVVMPGKSGVEVFEELAASEATRHIPVIFLTATTESHELERLRALDPTGIIRKPFDPMELASQVEAILAERDSARRR